MINILQSQSDQALARLTLVYNYKRLQLETMIKLRLKRFGKKNQSSFRLVAVNSTSRRDGKPLEELGFYNPSTKESKLNTENIKQRIIDGAQPTDTVKNLLLKAGIITK